MPHGTDLAVALDDETVRHGRVSEVTATTLTLWERHGADAIPRGSIARVAQRIDRGTARGPGFLRSTLVAAAISGVLGAVVAAMGENGLTTDDGVGVFAIGTIAGAAYGASRAPARKYEDRLIYIRP